MRVQRDQRTIRFRHLPQYRIANRDHHRLGFWLVDLVAIRVEFQFCRRSCLFGIQNFTLQFGDHDVAHIQAALAFGRLVSRSPFDFLGGQRDGRAICQQQFSASGAKLGNQRSFPSAIATGQFHIVQLFENVFSLRVQCRDRTAPTMTTVISNQSVLQRILRGQLQLGVDG